MDDLAIIGLYHRRDEGAIAASERKYGALCRSVAGNILTLREDVEECVNDTWQAAWNAMPPAWPAALGAFLGRITRNLSISRWRRDHARKRFEGMEIMLSELEECVPAPGSVEGELDRRLLSQAISGWLDTLEEGDRDLFVRRYWYGDRVQALAGERGVGANALSQRLLRLRRGLKDFLEREGVYDG